jgi:hypothetical protein
VQTSAPSSINAWLKSPQFLSGNNASAVSHSRPVRPNTRANTRSTLPSTTGARTPKAMLAMAPAV